MGQVRRFSALAMVLALLCLPAAAHAGVFGTPFATQTVLPPGFSESVVWDDLVSPTVVRFAPDGRVFVASKSGTIEVFDGLADRTPERYADLRTQVVDYWDRGLLGMALDPDFTTGRPFGYVLYA
jgi:glucose/arabinose dehydrogenase